MRSEKCIAITIAIVFATFLIGTWLLNLRHLSGEFENTFNTLGSGCAQKNLRLETSVHPEIITLSNEGHKESIPLKLRIKVVNVSQEPRVFNWYDALHPKIASGLYNRPYKISGGINVTPLPTSRHIAEIQPQESYSLEFDGNLNSFKEEMAIYFLIDGFHWQFLNVKKGNNYIWIDFKTTPPEFQIYEPYKRIIKDICTGQNISQRFRLNIRHDAE